jgi:hypothetical protein
MLEQVAMNKSGLYLNIQESNTQTLQVWIMIIKIESITKVIKMPSWKAWVQRPSGLIKEE